MYGTQISCAVGAVNLTLVPGFCSMIFKYPKHGVADATRECDPKPQKQFRTSRPSNTHNSFPKPHPSRPHIDSGHRTSPEVAHWCKRGRGWGGRRVRCIVTHRTAHPCGHAVRSDDAKRDRISGIPRTLALPARSAVIRLHRLTGRTNRRTTGRWTGVPSMRSGRLVLCRR